MMEGARGCGETYSTRSFLEERDGVCKGMGVNVVCQKVPCWQSTRTGTELTLSRRCLQPVLHKGRSHPAGSGCMETPCSHFREIILTAGTDEKLELRK